MTFQAETGFFACDFPRLAIDQEAIDLVVVQVSRDPDWQQNVLERDVGLARLDLEIPVRVARHLLGDIRADLRIHDPVGHVKTRIHIPLIHLRRMPQDELAIIVHDLLQLKGENLL